MNAMNKEMLRLALPSMLANLTVPLVGMVDIAVAGHLNASAAALIGGVSVGSLMFDLLYWNFGFLRAGTGGMTAQAYGRSDWKDCADNLKRGVGLAFLIALAMILVQWPFQKLIFLFVGCSEEVRTLALDYFYIRIWAAPATLSLMAFRGWFIGMQDTFSSMLADVIVNGGNILFSILLTFGLPSLGFEGLGYKGIALGTVVAQYSGLIFAASRVLVKFRNVFEGSPLLSTAPFRGSEVRRFFSVNRDLFIRSVCLIVVYLAFTAISSRLGDVLLAASSIMLKLLLTFSYFTDGFAFAGEALTGRFIGMRAPKMVRRTVNYTFAWSMAIGTLFVFIYAALGVPMIRLLTSDPSVVAAASMFMPWLVFFPLISCPAFTWDGIYTGATATKPMRDSNIGCVAAFFAVWLIGSLLIDSPVPASGVGAYGAAGAAGASGALDAARAFSGAVAAGAADAFSGAVAAGAADAFSGAGSLDSSGLGAFDAASVAGAHLLFAAYYAHLIYRSLYQTFHYKKSILNPLLIS